MEVIVVRYNLVIVDSDFNYAVKLMEFMNQKKDTLFTASAFTHISKYLAYAGENQTDILLCSEEYREELSSYKNESVADIQILLLKHMKKDTHGELSIYKYQSAQLIYKETAEIFHKAKRGDMPIEGQSETSIVGILPIFNQEACFYFGILAADYHEDFIQSLYISFDPFFSPYPFGLKKECNAVTDSLSMIKMRSDHVREYLSSIIIKTENCDVFGGCMHWADCSEIEEKEAAELISHIKDLKQYQRIIIDLGGFNRMTGGLFKLLHRLVIPIPQTIYEKERLNMFYKQAELSGFYIDNLTDLLPLDSIKKELAVFCSEKEENILEYLKKSSMIELVQAFWKH